MATVTSKISRQIKQRKCVFLPFQEMDTKIDFKKYGQPCNFDFKGANFKQTNTIHTKQLMFRKFLHFHN